MEEQAEKQEETPIERFRRINIELGRRRREFYLTDEEHSHLRSFLKALRKGAFS